MTDLLKLVASLSLSGSILAGLVWLCRRAVGRQLPRAAFCWLWLVVLLRLVLPFGVPNSLMTRLFAPQAVVQETDPPVPQQDLPPQAAFPAGEEAVSELPQAAVPAPEVPAASQGPRQPAFQLPPAQTVLFAVWAAGAALCFGRTVFSYLQLRQSLKKEGVAPDPEDLAIFRRMYGQMDGLWPVQLVCSTAARTPMLLGILRPVLVLPAHAFAKNGQSDVLRCLLRHEMIHHSQHHLWLKWLGLLARALHWFNPLVPAMLRTMEQDCELACDAAVTARMTEVGRRCYGNTLLLYAADRALPRYAPATTLNGGGKKFLRARLLQIKQPARHSKGTAALALLLCCVLGGCGAVLGSTAQPRAGRLSAEEDAASAPAASTPSSLPDSPSAGNTASVPQSDDVLVTIRDYIPGLYIDLKYATADNLTGAPLYSFTEPQLRYGTVKKLAAAQQTLNTQGYSLKIWDAYRPMEAQQALWAACPDPVYVSDPATGYLGHTRGNTVDVTLVTLDGKDLAMPSGFDQFDAHADRDYSDVSATAAAHASILQAAMEAAGFVGYAAEWSHYSDRVEYPKIERAALTAQQAYAALLAGDHSLLGEKDTARWWIPYFEMLGISYEYAYLDLDGDGSEELLVQMAGSPEGYNGVFHFENGRLFCWNSDAAEGNCRDYPLRDGTMVRQYDLGGSRSYTLFRYRSDGTMEQTAQLFERWERMEGEEPAPCPYYTVNGTEVDKQTFGTQLAALVTALLPGPTFWNTL